ncbi:Myb/SANT-like DNA-binding domain [Popillia japonica]|uniref:Regulatory protein zeste n=1 Tax=Popillia japonica TaxID=7064 RepID=A0AAW1JC64_POPJA
MIECKTTNKLSLGDKGNAWQKIAASFNAKNLYARSVEQIKTKYDNLKAKARKEVAMLKVTRTDTGGGPGVGDLDCVFEVQFDRSVHAQDVQVDLVEPASQNIENLPVVEDHLPVDRNIIEVHSTSDTAAEVLIDSEPAVLEQVYANKIKIKNP